MKIDLNHIPNNTGTRIDTSPLRDAVAQLRAARAAFGKRSDFGRKIKHAIITLTRKLIRAEDFNLRVLLKCEMLQNARWREQVFRHLGGDAAQDRWDARNARSKRVVLGPQITPRGNDEDTASAPPEAAPHETINIPGTDAVEFKVTHIKTDRDGLFCLAPIKFRVHPLTAIEAHAKWKVQTWNAALSLPKSKTYKTKRPETFKPIPVTPDELRSARANNPHPEAIAYARNWENTQNAPQSTPCPNTAPLLETRSLFLIPDKRGPP